MALGFLVTQEGRPVQNVEGEGEVGLGESGAA